MYENVIHSCAVIFPIRFSPYLFQKELSYVCLVRGELFFFEPICCILFLSEIYVK